MRKGFLCGLLVLATLIPAAASAQVGNEGSLRGYIKDEQGAVLPGVTVTATSPAMLGPATAVTGTDGYFRLVNLPPGTFTLTAELAGFQTHKREGILLRAGANFQVDITLTIGALAETITVSGESPMLEVSRASNVLNIDGDFQAQLPIAARRNWTDFLEQTPGVHSRPFDDGSGRMVYFGHATEHFAHVVQLEGMQAGNYNDFQLTYVAMGSDMIQETQVKTGGVDASTPMGTGLAINVVTKSGGNVFKGTGGSAYQPLKWNDNNTAAETVFVLPAEVAAVANATQKVSKGGTPAQTGLRQFDASLGGPIKKDKMWFFGTFRYADTDVPIARITKQINDIKAYFPDAGLFNNKVKSYQPYAKVTTKLSPSHELAVLYQRDRLNGSNNWEYFFNQKNVYGNGGDLYTAKLSSVWGQNLTSTLLAGYNNKGGADASTYKAFGANLTGPSIEIWEGTRIANGLITGNSLILEGGNRSTESTSPASVITIRGDITWYKSGLGGSHEIQTGFFIEPRNTYDTTTVYTNNGFVLERRTPIDVARPQLGTRPFYREYRDPLSLLTRQARDSDYAVYLQDSWKPNERLTINGGLRVDYVKRVDKVFGITRQSSTEVQPRLSASYLLTRDARNVLRGSYVRVAEQVMGRDAITTFGADSRANERLEYDNDLNGTFETIRLNPATTSTLASYEIAPDVSQPYLDEFIVGLRRQFPMQTSVDIGFISRSYQNMWARIDVNGRYPSGPGLPFGGFGLVDPNRGIVFQQTNNTWSTLEYRAIELTVAKNMSHGFQFVAGFNRQWHWMSGTWNPTDPARFVQPNHFENRNANQYMPRGNNDENSLPNTGNALSYGPTWMKYRGNAAFTWIAPFQITTALSYTLQAGPWSGSPLKQLAANDPDVLRYGPATVTLANGSTQPNPLATRNRYIYSNRGEGQFNAPAIHTVGLKAGKIVRFGRREVEVAGTIFNLLNAGDFTQFTYNSAYQAFSTNFLEMRNRQPARAFQLTTVVRF